MKKTMAAAILAAAGAGAFAQSGVTMFGVIDQAVTKGNGGTAANQAGNGTNKAWIMKSSANNRLGFRGNEDLGGGLSAQFLLDHRFNADTGTSAPIFWNGRSWVQLTSSTLGSVWMGRDYFVTFYVAVKSDPFGFDGVGSIGTDSFAGFLATDIFRTANTIGYKSPRIGSGLTFQVTSSLGEGTTSRENGLLVEYRNGPVYVGTGYEKIEGGPAVIDGNSLQNVAFHYDFGFVKPMVYLAEGKTGGGKLTNSSFMLGALAPLGKSGTLKMVFSRLNKSGADNTIDKYGLGYNHSLSKRTTLYGDLGFAKEDRKTDNVAYSLGVRHDF